MRGRVSPIKPTSCYPVTLGLSARRIGVKLRTPSQIECFDHRWSQSFVCPRFNPSTYAQLAGGTIVRDWIYPINAYYVLSRCLWLKATRIGVKQVTPGQISYFDLRDPKVYGLWFYLIVLKCHWRLGAIAPDPHIYVNVISFQFLYISFKKIQIWLYRSFLFRNIPFDNLEGGLGYFLPQKHVCWDASILFTFAPQTPTISANCFYNIIPNLPPPTPYWCVCFLSSYSQRSSNRFNHVVEAKRFESVFVCRKVCWIQKSKSWKKIGWYIKLLCATEYPRGRHILKLALKWCTLFRLSEKMAMTSWIILPVRSRVQSQYAYIEFILEM